MECPKCAGGAYLAEEELVQVLNTEPVKVISKATFVCRSCSERFTRLVCEPLDAKRRPPEAPYAYGGAFVYSNQKQQAQAAQPDPAEGLRFF